MTRAPLRDARRIVVRMPNWLGDVVMATPGLRALRRHAPDAHISVQLPGVLAPLLEGSPHVDAIVAMDGRPQGVRALRREARRLRAAGPFDYGVCLPESFSSALLLRWAGVRRVGGFARGGRSVLMHDAIEAPRHWGRRRLVAREIFVTTLLEALGCPDDGTALELHATAAATREAGRLLGATDPSGSIVGFAPGASFGPSKQWPEASFAALADRFAARGDVVVWLGAASERPLVERIRGQMRGESRSLVGDTPLGVLAALMQRLDLLVCNDAGARHVAVASGAPVVVFMGPTALEKTAENLERVVVLTHDVACRPCYQRVCPIDHGCMTGITPGHAWEAAKRLCAPPAVRGAGASAGRLE